MIIKKHPELLNVLIKLSKYAASIICSIHHKNNIELIQSHIANKAKVYMECSTRWSSSVLMLVSFQKAYKNGAFDNLENKCPVSLEEIEKYLQILWPAHLFNLFMQTDSTTIGDVVPFLVVMFSRWNKMDVTGCYKLLCKQLVAGFKYQFDFEINSHVYHVASLLNTGLLYKWYHRQDDISVKIKENIQTKIKAVDEKFKKNKQELIAQSSTDSFEKSKLSKKNVSSEVYDEDDDDDLCYFFNSDALQKSINKEDAYSNGKHFGF